MLGSIKLDIKRRSLVHEKLIYFSPSLRKNLPRKCWFFAAIIDYILLVSKTPLPPPPPPFYLCPPVKVIAFDTSVFTEVIFCESLEAPNYINLNYLSYTSFLSEASLKTTRANNPVLGIFHFCSDLGKSWVSCQDIAGKSKNFLRYHCPDDQNFQIFTDLGGWTKRYVYKHCNCYYNFFIQLIFVYIERTFFYLCNKHEQLDYFLMVFTNGWKFLLRTRWIELLGGRMIWYWVFYAIIVSNTYHPRH